MKKTELIILIAILLLGAFLRFYGLNWDQGYHLHPDERAITMISEGIHWPREGEWSKIFTPESPLNPKFFAYGSLPIYLLKIMGYLTSFINPSFGQYDKLNLVGRALSTLFDTATIFSTYFLGKRLLFKSSKPALIASLFYGLSVLPIQLSHFYAVDTLLSFFMTLVIVLLVSYHEKPSAKKIALAGILSGLAISTKFTAIFLIVPVLVTLGLTIMLNSFRNKTTLKAIKQITIHSSLFIINCSLFIFLTMPYAFLDIITFRSSLLEQLQMSRDPYVFPYTLQYVNTKPYIYPLQQILLWGLGPAISLFSLAGFLSLLRNLSSRFRQEMPYKNPWLTPLIFSLSYFLLMGQSAVKFMRYYLPLYPLLALFSGYFIWKVTIYIESTLGTAWSKIITGLILISAVIWPSAFISIYSQPNTRFTATQWIKTNIREGSILAVEHWDDHLPITGSEKYRFVEMPMYEPDTDAKKWEIVERNLKEADYIILASNRLYVPLQRLIDCSKIKYLWRCYPKTAEYYQKLFSGELGFTIIREFTNYPTLFLAGNQLEINDSVADENFTVFDHPKIIIFENLRSQTFVSGMITDRGRVAR